MTNDIQGRQSRIGNRSLRKESSEVNEGTKSQYDDDLEFLMRRPEFLRVMKSFLNRGKVMTSVMTGNSQTFYNSGRQDFAREIWVELAKRDNSVGIELLIPETNKED